MSPTLLSVLRVPPQSIIGTGVLLSNLVAPGVGVETSRNRDLLIACRVQVLFGRRDQIKKLGEEEEYVRVLMRTVR